ncbi:MAG: carbohydrate ABC transporter permease [Actinobacteria bacterium]|nr:carbohydrate ABC transporter permease [Actinomycetota bacterium]
MKKKYPWKILLYIVLGIGALTMLIPFVWMLSTSLKSINEVFTYPPAIFGKVFNWNNYLKISERYPFGRFFINSTIVTSVVVVVQLFTSSLGGYVFARLKFKFRDILFLMYLSTMMVPIHVTLIPVFLIMRYLGLVDRLPSLILTDLATAFGTFLMRQFYLTIPDSLEDAAKIDGCNPFTTYWRIFLPLSKPALATLGVFIFMGMWNDFIRPLIFISSIENMTLPLGLANMKGMYATDWPVLMAGTFISLLPVLIFFLIAQDFFVRSVTLSGLKE